MFLQENLIFNNSFRSIVLVEGLMRMSLYKGKTNEFFTGTGVLLNKEKGWIVTNKHVANRNEIADFFVSFYDHSRVKATLFYNDPHHDFAFISVEPKYIPLDMKGMPVSHISAIGERLFMIGYDENENYIFKEGLLATKEDTKGLFSNHVYITDMVNKGGSSGSPMFNEKGELVSLHFASNMKISASVPGVYIHDALEAFNGNIYPARQTIGATFKFCTIHEMAQFASFPPHAVAYYEKHVPSLNAICIHKTQKNTPAEIILHNEDIIWSINGHLIGSDMHHLQRIINGAKENISLALYHYGILSNITIAPYDLYKNLPSKMVIIDNNIFYEADEYTQSLTGVNQKEVFIFEPQKNSSFSSMARSSIKTLDNHPITTLNALIEILPHLIEKKHFLASIQHYAPHMGFGKMLITDHALITEKISLPSSLNLEALEFNQELYQWMNIYTEDEVILNDYTML